MTSYLGGLDDLVWQVDLREGVHGACDLVQFDAFDRVEDLGRHLGLLVQLTQHSLLLLWWSMCKRKQTCAAGAWSRCPCQCSRLGKAAQLKRTTSATYTLRVSALRLCYIYMYVYIYTWMYIYMHTSTHVRRWIRIIRTITRKIQQAFQPNCSCSLEIHTALHKACFQRSFNDSDTRTSFHWSYDGSPGLGGLTTTSMAAWPDTDGQSLAEIDFISMAITSGSRLTASQ